MVPLDVLTKVEKSSRPSDFGNALARLATAIVAEHGARKLSAEARVSSLSALRADTRRRISANTAHRAVVAAKIAGDAAALRKSLAAGEAALSATVQRSLAAARPDLSATPETIAADAQSLRLSLDVSHHAASAAVPAFRAEVRHEQTAPAAALAASLGQCVADVRRDDTAAILSAVPDQFPVARGIWGQATTTAITASPAPSIALAQVPVAPPNRRAEVAPAAVLNVDERRWVPRAP
jgi:hypothetical protein